MLKKIFFFSEIHIHAIPVAVSSAHGNFSLLTSTMPLERQARFTGHVYLCL